MVVYKDIKPNNYIITHAPYYRCSKLTKMKNFSIHIVESMMPLHSANCSNWLLVSVDQFEFRISLFLKNETSSLVGARSNGPNYVRHCYEQSNSNRLGGKEMDHLDLLGCKIYWSSLFVLINPINIPKLHHVELCHSLIFGWIV